MLRRSCFALIALIAGLLFAGSSLVAQSGVVLNDPNFSNNLHFYRAIKR